MVRENKMNNNFPQHAASPLDAYARFFNVNGEGEGHVTMDDDDGYAIGGYGGGFGYGGGGSGGGDIGGGGGANNNSGSGGSIQGELDAVANFYGNLDAYLRSHRLTIKELFARFATGGDNGAMTPRELRAMLQETAPGVSHSALIAIQSRANLGLDGRELFPS